MPTEKIVAFMDVDIEKKGKGDVEEPTVSIMSAQNTPVTSGQTTPTGMLSPKHEPEVYELPIIPAGNFTAPPGTDSVSTLAECPRKQRRTEIMSFCALLLSIFAEGWNDGSNGPLIPVMQSHYKVCLLSRVLECRVPNFNLADRLHRCVNDLRAELHCERFCAEHARLNSRVIILRDLYPGHSQTSSLFKNSDSDW